MIELGSLVVKTPEALVEARRKIVRLTGDLGYAEFHAARLSSIFLELLRLGLRSNTGARVAISIENRNGGNGLSFIFSYGEKVSPVSGAALFFDAFDITCPDGSPTIISAYRRFSNRDFHPTSQLIESLQQMLALPSINELMRDLHEKNRDLRESAEQTRLAKDAAEKASASLQQRVKELAGARFAMLNIMEDLSGKNEELIESEQQIRLAKEQAEEASEALQLRVDELAEARRAMLNVMEDLGEANRELETAHRLILDSIQYASRIQRALLPGESLLRQVFPQCMVIWEPRDVVGGDIFWCRAWGEGHLLILGDCTGHGVPGAFMTLIANGALDHAMQEAAPGDSAGLIGHMHRLMQTWLGQNTDEGDSDDGIELGACYIPPDRKQIVFAGARFTLFHINDGVVAEVSGDKKGIGFRGIPHHAAFTNRVVEVAPKRCFFLTTDGMIDQVGGEKRRGFGKKRFGRLVAGLADIPLQDQGRYFLQELAGYQGEEKRRDDVSIIGFSLDSA